MNYQEIVRLISKAGVEPIDRPVSADSLGLPDAARCRLLTELGGLLRVYHTETPGGLPSVPRLRSKLEGTGYDELVLATSDGEEFLAVRVDAQGDEVHKALTAAETEGLLKNAGLGEEDPVSVSDRILELLTREEEPKAYDNRGLFSDDYLERRVPESDEWVSADVSAAYEGFRKLYADKKDSLAGMDEANTEMEFLEPALALLGFHPVKQAKTKAGSKPDYALFGSAEEKGAASKSGKGSEGFYARTLAVVEGKYWGRNLDVYTKKEDRRESEKQTSSPEMQLVRYLRETEVSWGLLTNGAEWRLYHGDALGKAKKYYSVDFERVLQSEDDFRRFFLFFRREAFAPKGPESKSFLDGVLEGSERYAIRVGNNLKDVVFTHVFPQLARGFLENHTREQNLPVDEEALKKVYRGTLALLYRLLFLLYAESRDLLPTGDFLGYGARGINAIKEQVAERLDKEYTYTGGYVLWQSLVDLFRIVDEGNRELKVPPYNGGLFRDNGNHELLGTHRISDHHLAPALDALSRQRDEDGENRFVDYGFVGVRELGSVYEGLLEFSLKIADEDLVAVKESSKEVYVKAGTQGRKRVVGRVGKGEPYLVNDKKERKATGSYYTPRYIVDFIVENALGPLVEERRSALKERLEEVRRTDDYLKRSRKNEEDRAERRREAGALETLLDVKVLDPAMGSGHFLVAAVDYLTDEFSRLISELDAGPIIEQLAYLRQEIEESLEKYGTVASEEQLSDANLLKRMILKRCVYGVDQNEMAVELAKLSLWLDAFTAGAPLSFLDHHLKHGNSLLGSSIPEVRQEVESSGTLLGNQFTDLLIKGTELMQQVGEIPDATVDEVRRSVLNYRRADLALEPYKRVMDVWTSQHFGNVGAQSFLKDELSSGGADSFVKSDYNTFAKQGQDVIARAGVISKGERFFHWELEFPEVFYEGTHVRDNPGFDAVVTNPPYFQLQGTGLQNPLSGIYPDIYSGSNDVSNFFLARGSQLLKEGASMGVIVARYWLEAYFTDKLRRFLSTHVHPSTIVDFGNLQVWPDVNVLTIVSFFKKAPVAHVQLYIPDENQVTSAKEFHSSILNLAHKPLIAEASEFGSDPWYLRSIENASLWRKIRAQSVNLDEITENTQGVKTGNNNAFTVSAETADEAGLERDVLVPVAEAQNVRRYTLQADEFVIYTDGSSDIDTVPAVKSYLLKFKQALASRAECNRGQYPWWRLQRPRDRDQLLHGERILVPLYSTYNRFYYSRNVVVGMTDVYIIFVTDDNYKAPFLAAVLNSRLLNRYHQIFCKVKRAGYLEYSGNAISDLPIRHISFSTVDTERHLLGSQGRTLYDQCSAQGSYAPLMEFVCMHLPLSSERISNDTREHSDVVHDLLAYIAEEMIRMHSERVEIEETWREWVEAAIPEADELTQDFLDRGWVELGLREGWNGVKSVLRAKAVVPPAKTLQDLRRETEDAIKALRPLYERIEATDRLLDQIVYQLYDLTEEEIAVVEESVKGS